MTGYELRARSDEARNSRSWERRGEERKTLGMIHENEHKAKDQGGKIEQNEDTRLICP